MGTNLTTYDSIQQTIATGVAGGSVIEFSANWGNGGGAQGSNGNQVDFQVRYNGVTYATMLTSPLAGGTPAAPGPSAGSSAAANNGATLTTVSGGWTTVGTVTVFRLTLPAGVPPGGVLQFRTSREQNAASDGATDDISIFGVQIESPTVCLVKQTTNQTGTPTFNFTTANADTDIATAAVNTTASITTTSAGTPVSLDTSAAIAGTQPMLLTNRNAVTTITETIPTDYKVTNIVCTGLSASPTVNLGTGQLSIAANAVPVGAPAICTYTNSRLEANLQTVKTRTSQSPALTGSTVIFTIVVTNNGPDAATNVTLADVVPAGLTVTSVNTPPPTAGSASNTGNNVSWSIPTLANAASATLTITATIN